ncbi:MAG: hypothetical protein LBE27_04930 [Deltaproteobacteria bacterium]|nr:hypothetical protein [Deltaproteobacteria bacterium]
MESEIQRIKGNATVRLIHLYSVMGTPHKSEKLFLSPYICFADKETTYEFVSLLSLSFDKYLNQNEIKKARKIFDNVLKLTICQQVKVVFNYMASKLIQAYQKHGNLKSCDDIYREVSSKSTPDDFKAFHAATVKNVMETCLKTGEAYQGLSVFAGLRLDEVPIEQVNSIAHLAASSVTSLLHLRDLDSAEKYLNVMKHMAVSPNLLKITERVGLNLILALESSDQSAWAVRVFKSMRLLFHKGQMDAMYAYAIKTLVVSLAKKGDLEDALGLAEYMSSLGVTHDALMTRVEASLELVRAFRAQESGIVGEARLKVPTALIGGFTSGELLQHIEKGDINTLGLDIGAFNLNDALPSECPPWAEALERLAYLYLEKNQINDAKAVFMKMGETFNKSLRTLAEARTRLGEVLVEGLIGENRLDEGLKVLKIMFRIGYLPEMLFIKARTFAKLAGAYAKAGNYPQAEKIITAMKELPFSHEICAIRAMATEECLKNMPKYSDMAMSLYDSLNNLPRTPEVLHWKGMAAVNIMVMLINAEEYEKSFKFYLNVSKNPEFGYLSEQIRGNMTIALWKIIDVELAKNNARVANDAYRLINSPKLPEEESNFYRSISAIDLIEELGEDGKTMEAESLFYSLRNFPKETFSDTQIASAGTHVITALMKKRAYKRAIEVMEELLKLSRTPSVNYELAKAYANMAMIYSDHGHMKRCLVYLEKLDGFDKDPKISALKAETTSKIIIDFVEDGMTSSAIEMYKTIEEIKSPNDALLFRLEAASKIIKRCVEDDKIEEFQDIYKNLLEFSENKDKCIEKCLSDIQKIYEKAAPVSDKLMTHDELPHKKKKK